MIYELIGPTKGKLQSHNLNRTFTIILLQRLTETNRNNRDLTYQKEQPLADRRQAEAALYKRGKNPRVYSHSICPLILFSINSIKSILALLYILFLFIGFFASILQAQHYSLSNKSKYSSSFSFDTAFLTVLIIICYAKVFSFLFFSLAPHIFYSFNNCSIIRLSIFPLYPKIFSCTHRL